MYGCKVLYITESITPFVVGGMQEVARKHAMYLEEGRYVFAVVYSRVQQNVPRSLEEGKMMIRLPWPEQELSWLRYPGRYAFELAKYSKSVAKIMTDFKPDVVYAEGPVAKAILAMQDHPTVIFHPHGLNSFQSSINWADFIRLWQFKRLIKFHCKYSDFVISQGGKLTDILITKCGVPSSKIRVLSNSCDEPLCSNMQHSRRFLFVGRFDKVKRLKLVLEIFSVLPHLQLDVVGCDRMKKIPDNITFHGIVRDREKLMQMYRKAFVLIVPSISEGMPTVILEAMSQGTPVIATDVGACCDLVLNKKTGWLIEAGKREALKKTILEAADTDVNEYNEMSNNCVKLIAEKFSSTVVRSALYAIFDEAIEFSQRGK